MSNNTQSLPNQEKLNVITPVDQDFNFEIWAMAVRKQMMLVLNHKESAIEGYSPSNLGKIP